MAPDLGEFLPGGRAYRKPFQREDGTQLVVYLPLNLEERPTLASRVRKAGGDVTDRIAKASIAVIDTTKFSRLGEAREQFRQAQALPTPLPCVGPNWLSDSLKTQLAQNPRNPAYDPLAQITDVEKKEKRKGSPERMKRSAHERNFYTAQDRRDILEHLMVTKNPFGGRRNAQELEAKYPRHSWMSYQSYLRDNLDNGACLRAKLMEYQRTGKNPVILPARLRVAPNKFVGEAVAPRSPSSDSDTSVASVRSNEAHGVDENAESAHEDVADHHGAQQESQDDIDDPILDSSARVRNGSAVVDAGARRSGSVGSESSMHSNSGTTPQNAAEFADEEKKFLSYAVKSALEDHLQCLSPGESDSETVDHLHRTAWESGIISEYVRAMWYSSGFARTHKPWDIVCEHLNKNREHYSRAAELLMCLGDSPDRHIQPDVPRSEKGESHASKTFSGLLGPVVLNVEDQQGETQSLPSSGRQNEPVASSAEVNRRSPPKHSHQKHDEEGSGQFTSRTSDRFDDIEADLDQSGTREQLKADGARIAIKRNHVLPGAAIVPGRPAADEVNVGLSGPNRDIAYGEDSSHRRRDLSPPTTGIDGPLDVEAELSRSSGCQPGSTNEARPRSESSPVGANPQANHTPESQRRLQPRPVCSEDSPIEAASTEQARMRKAGSHEHFVDVEKKLLNKALTKKKYGHKADAGLIYDNQARSPSRRDSKPAQSVQLHDTPRRQEKRRAVHTAMPQAAGAQYASRYSPSDSDVDVTSLGRSRIDETVRRMSSAEPLTEGPSREGTFEGATPVDQNDTPMYCPASPGPSRQRTVAVHSNYTPIANVETTGFGGKTRTMPSESAPTHQQAQSSRRPSALDPSKSAMFDATISRRSAHFSGREEEVSSTSRHHQRQQRLDLSRYEYSPEGKIVEEIRSRRRHGSGAATTSAYDTSNSRRDIDHGRSAAAFRGGESSTTPRDISTTSRAHRSAIDLELAKVQYKASVLKLCKAWGFSSMQQLKPFLTPANGDIKRTTARLQRHFDGLASEYNTTRENVIEVVRACEGRLLQAEKRLEEECEEAEPAEIQERSFSRRRHGERDVSAQFTDGTYSQILGLLGRNNHHDDDGVHDHSQEPLRPNDQSNDNPARRKRPDRHRKESGDFRGGVSRGTIVIKEEPDLDDTGHVTTTRARSRRPPGRHFEEDDYSEDFEEAYRREHRLPPGVTAGNHSRRSVSPSSDTVFQSREARDRPKTSSRARLGKQDQHRSHHGYHQSLSPRPPAPRANTSAMTAHGGISRSHRERMYDDHPRPSKRIRQQF